MAKDRSKIVMDREGNAAVYDGDGVLSQVMVDGKVRNVRVSRQDRDEIKRRR